MFKYEKKKFWLTNFLKYVPNVIKRKKNDKKRFIFFIFRRPISQSKIVRWPIFLMKCWALRVLFKFVYISLSPQSTLNCRKSFVCHVCRCGTRSFSRVCYFKWFWKRTFHYKTHFSLQNRYFWFFQKTSVL